jgi:hypothetical protein
MLLNIYIYGDMLWILDCATVQAVRRWFLTAEPRVQCQVTLCKFVVGEVRLYQGLFGCALLSPFHPLQHTCLSLPLPLPGVWRTWTGRTRSHPCSLRPGIHLWAGPVIDTEQIIFYSLYLADDLNMLYNKDSLWHWHFEIHQYGLTDRACRNSTANMQDTKLTQ